MPSNVEIVGERVFDAPRELVFKTYTDPALIPQWWGPRDHITIVDKMDVRPGGSWRFLNPGPDGVENAFSGVYREVEPSSRLVFTFNYEPLPGNHEVLETVTFEEVDGKTRIVDHLRFLNVEDRDGMVQSGMEKGANETLDRFTELLARLQSGQGA
jgi:uncharacterized protein YndB with AHSA1/START domain